MLGLTPLGTIHTAVSLVAVAAGINAFVRDGAIAFRNRTGRIYVLATILTCLTGFGIFQHGGFGIPHVLGVITLVVLAIVATAASTPLFGRASPYLETVGLSTTFFFHMIPGFTETATRLPPRRATRNRSRRRCLAGRPHVGACPVPARRRAPGAALAPERFDGRSRFSGAAGTALAESYESRRFKL